MNIGILIGRLNPPHIGHMRILDESLVNDTKTLLFLGSSNITDKKNPFSFNERKNFIIKLYKDNKLFIDNIDDLPTDEDWVELLNKKLLKLKIPLDSKITFYGGDLENDYAIVVLKKFKEILLYKNIIYTEISRKELFIDHENSKFEISSTVVREAIKNQDKELLKKLINSRLHNDFI